MLQRRQQQEWTMLQQQQQQQQSQLQAQQEECMRQQLALQQTASPMPLLPLVPPISPTFALPEPVPPLLRLPISVHGSVQRGAINRSQSICTADAAPVLGTASASSSANTSFASVAAGTYEMPPPAYSSADHSADD